MGRFVALCSLIALLCCCSTITEDRSKCPNWYVIDFSEVNSSIENLHLWFFDENGTLLFYDTLYPYEYENLYEMELKRGKVNLYVWGNLLANTLLENIITSEASLIKIETAQADSLYRYYKTLDTDGESGLDTVIVRKEYTKLSVQMMGAELLDVPIKMRLDCSTCGRYVNGDFIESQSSIYANPIEESGMYYSAFNLFRQRVLQDLKLSVIKQDKVEKYLLREFPIGEIMVQQGYDMDADNLKDITINIDISIGVISLVCEDWQVVVPVNIRL